MAVGAVAVIALGRGIRSRRSGRHPPRRGERLGIALAPVVGVLDLSEIVLSGPIELLDGPLAEATVETLRKRTLAQFQDSVRVRMTEQGQDIVLRGAAVMVLSGQLGVS
nr:hypothetical protein GCM10025699_01680 [Microbacterium flavescens]